MRSAAKHPLCPYLVNPAHFLLILFQVLGMARDRPSPYVREWRVSSRIVRVWPPRFLLCLNRLEILLIS